MTSPRITRAQLRQRFESGYVGEPLAPASGPGSYVMQLRFLVRDGVDAAALLNTLRDAVQEYASRVERV